MRPYLALLAVALAIPEYSTAATVGPTDRFIPLIQDGGGWSTRVTLTNLSDKRTTVVVAFMTENGSNENWRLNLKLTAGKALDSVVEIPLAPGATAIVETSGTAPAMTRGFADIVEIGEQPIGAFATLTRKSEDGVVQSSFKVPLLPAHEKRSIIPIDLTDPLQSSHMVWVSLTSTTTLDIVFRDLSGALVFTDQVNFGGKAQLSLDLLEYWPQLKDFRGTMQWSVSFPGADRYEQRILSGLCLLGRGGQPFSVINSMTLPADQASASPY